MPWCEEGAAAVLLQAREMIYLTAKNTVMYTAHLSSKRVHLFPADC